MERREFIKNGTLSGLSLMCSAYTHLSGRVHFSDAPLKAGVAQSNITPLMDVPLDGVILKNSRIKHIHDELFVRCLVLDDGHQKLAIAVADNTMISTEVIDQAKKLILDQTGIPPEQVLVSATHTHSTPRAIIDLVPDSTAHQNYLGYLSMRICESVRRALNVMVPARLGWGSTSNPNHVFNRRWWLKEDVSYQNPLGGQGDRIKMNPKKEEVSHPAGPVDPEIFVLAVQDEAGRPLAILANYGLHYVGGIPGGTVSADYYGVFARKLQQYFGGDAHPDFVGMMSNGTSGDVNNIDVQGPKRSHPPYERIDAVAEDVMKSVIEVYNAIQWRDDIRLATAYTTLTLRVRKPDQARLSWADSILNSIQNPGRLTRTEVYAQEARHLNNFPDTVDIPLQSLRIGDLAIAAIPVEVFAETGLAIKAQSPFGGSTFIMELANGYYGYLPTASQHQGGGYETWPARSSFLEVEAEKAIRDTTLELLRQMANR